MIRSEPDRECRTGMNQIRTDLLHLSPEALAQFANLGLVKRAIRELDAGEVPQLQLDAAATLTAHFADGVVTVWPQARSLRDTACSCGAAEVCRHRVMMALAYRRQATAAAGGDAPAPAPLTSPGGIDDAALAASLQPRQLAAARSERERGIQIEVCRVAAGEPCPTARLPAATVRFWGGAAIGAARCDCVQAGACEHVALGVWAFREADAVAADVASHRVRFGAAAPAPLVDAAPYRALVASILCHGIGSGTTPHQLPLSLALAAARDSGAIWLHLVVSELEIWLDGYARRSASFDPATGGEQVAELALRLAAGNCAGQARAALGVGEASEVELDRLRLICLGARLDADGEQRSARLILADLDTTTHFVLRHDWRLAPGGDEALTLAAQRLAPGVKLAALVGGQLLSRQARRTADGRLLLARSRSSQNALLPQAGDWSDLGRPLHIESIEDLHSEKAIRPLPQIGPKHAGGAFFVVDVRSVESVFYDPNEQAVGAVLLTADETPVTLLRRHRDLTRHALDACAGALGGHFGRLKQVAGNIDWVHGRPLIDPWAFGCDRTVVPDFEPACGVLASLPLGDAGLRGSDPIHGALREVAELLSLLFCQGTGALGPGWSERARAAAGVLRELALNALADAVDALREELRGGDPTAAAMYLAALRVLHREAMAGTVVVPGVTTYMPFP